MTLDDPILDTNEAADALRVRKPTLERWRTEGSGPEFVKLGRRVGYRRSALEEFVNSRTRQHTGQAA